MFEIASVGLVEVETHDGQLVHFNQKFCDITGYAAAELHGMSVRDLTHPDDRAADWDLFQRAVPARHRCTRMRNAMFAATVRSSGSA